MEVLQMCKPTVLNRLRSVYWRIYIVWLALWHIRQINLGDEVWYEGHQYRVADGVRRKSWRLSGLKNGDSGWVKRAECKKVRTLKNWWGSFRFSHRFYMVNWHSIWVNGGIKSWMRGCNIWPRRGGTRC